jgi:shikimate dehydrogenase
MNMATTGKTRLVPILAWPVDHVRAPTVYNPAFAAAGLDWLLVAMGVHPDHFAATLAPLARVSNLQGLNITIPHKAAAQAQCRWIGPEARRTGVVNTLRLHADGSWAGESFDGIGFVEAARAHGMLEPQRPALIVGTGGAGTAIAFALAAAGYREIQLVNREPARAEHLAHALKQAYPALHCLVGAQEAQRARLAVNATSLGLHAGEALPLDPRLLAADCAVFDIIAARDTEWMAACAERGLRVIGGRPMIEHQLAAQIAFWQGQTYPLEPRA